MKKVILVTGGAGDIGENIVKTLARKDYQVILNYNRSEQKSIEIKEELNKENIHIDIIKADLRDKKQVDNMVNEILNKYNKIDVLINNAGISRVNLFTEIEEDEWNEVIDSNLKTAFLTTQTVVKNMISNKEGLIINISSIWGEIGASCEVHYSVSKAGMDAMTKSLAKELGPSNIRVNSIAPGIINTKMNQNLSQQELNDIKEEIPLMKIGNPIDVSRCIEWLINDEYTTGQIISINGGWSI